MNLKKIEWVADEEGADGYIGPREPWKHLRVCQIVKEYGCYSIVQKITYLTERKVKGICFSELENAKEHFEKTVMKDIFDMFFEE